MKKAVLTLAAVSRLPATIQPGPFALVLELGHRIGAIPHSEAVRVERERRDSNPRPPA